MGRRPAECRRVTRETDIGEAALLTARQEGLLISPEAAATVAALGPLRERGVISADARVVLFLTASGLKNQDFFRQLMETKDARHD